MIFSAYNRADFHEPELFVANTVTMLAQFPEEVMTEVTNPRTGIQTRLKWPPKLSELREWGERVEGEHRARERRALLAQHRVLIDTPRGPEPLAEAEKPSQEARDRALAYWENEVRPQLQSRSGDERSNGPPPGLTDDGRREWYERRLETLRGQPLPPLPEAAKRSLGLGAYDRVPVAAE